MNKKITAAFLLLLTGCAFHQAPYIAYAGSPALSETAVFAAFDHQQQGVLSSILIVDDKETSCAQVGCPAWVRVLPGQHSFIVRYVPHFRLDGAFIIRRRAELTVTLPKMEARHVYQAHYREVDNTVTMSVEDLGERPKFGIDLGLEGVNRKYYPVEF